MIEKFPTLYNRDKLGSIRVWWAEIDGSAYRFVSGVQNGAEVRSEWKYGTIRNSGRSNELLPGQHARSVVDSEYRTRQEIGGYSLDIATAGVKKHFSPMLAAKWVDLKQVDRDNIIADGCYVQPKLDGIRCIAKADGLWTRNGKQIFGAPHIEEALKSFFDLNPEAILDGELYNHDFKNDFDTIVSCVKKQKPTEEDLEKSRRVVQYHIYDQPDVCLYNGDVDYNLLFGRRYANLLQLKMFIRDDIIQYVDTRIVTTAEELDRWYAIWLEAGYEGQMIRVDSPYENKRTKSLLKRKEFIDEEFEIVCIEEGVGNWSGAAKRVVAKLKDGRTFEAGMRGTYETNEKRLAESDLFVGGFATIRYQNLTPSGKPRFGVAIQMTKHNEERM